MKEITLPDRSICIPAKEVAIDKDPLLAILYAFDQHCKKDTDSPLSIQNLLDFIKHQLKIPNLAMSRQAGDRRLSTPMWIPSWGKKGLSQDTKLKNVGFVIGYDLVNFPLEAEDKAFAHFRVDWDPEKGLHINLEIEEGPHLAEKLKICFKPTILKEELEQAIRHCRKHYPEWVIPAESIEQTLKIYWWDKFTKDAKAYIPENIQQHIEKSTADYTPNTGSVHVKSAGIKKVAASAPTTPMTQTSALVVPSKPLSAPTIPPVLSRSAVRFFRSTSAAKAPRASQTASRST